MLGGGVSLLGSGVMGILSESAGPIPWSGVPPPCLPGVAAGDGDAPGSMPGVLRQGKSTRHEIAWKSLGELLGPTG